MGRRRGWVAVAGERGVWMARRQSMKVKISVGATLRLCSLVALKLTIENHNYFFVASEAIHALGILVLIYKLTTQNTCSGSPLSCPCHAYTPFYTAFSSQSNLYGVWCLLGISFSAASASFDALSVQPQLCLMQNAKMIEPFMAHYVFALGVSRFLACAHWIIQIYETRGRYLCMFGSCSLIYFGRLLRQEFHARPADNENAYLETLKLLKPCTF